MSRQSDLDVSSSKEPDVASLVQSEPYQSVDAEPGVQSKDEKTNKENYFFKNKKKNFFKVVVRSILFSLVVIVALAPPISTIAAIIFGLIHGFSWMLIFIPLVVWVLTGLLTVRLMIYKTGITFKR